MSPLSEGRRAAPVIVRFDSREEAAAFQALLERDRRAQNEALARYEQYFRAALAQTPKPPRKKPSLDTLIKQAERAGKIVTGSTSTRDGHTLNYGQATEPLGDTDAEWAAFEARHGKA